MATNATYVPILGSFAAPFSILSQDSSVVPANTAIARFQGTGRSGKMRTVFSLIVPDPTAPNTDDLFNIQVPCPYVFTADDIGANENDFWPLVSINPSDAASRTAAAVIQVADGAGWSVANQTLLLQLAITNPVALTPVEFYITVDFSHTMIS